MRNDVMVDIETLGKKKGASIFQIAAVHFNAETGEVLDTFESIGDIELYDKLSKFKFLDARNKKGHIRLANHGVIMSVQAGRYHYCTPQADLPIDEYETYEVAFIDMRFGFFVDLHSLTNKKFELEYNTRNSSELLGYVSAEQVEQIYLTLTNGTDV